MVTFHLEIFQSMNCPGINFLDLLNELLMGLQLVEIPQDQKTSRKLLLRYTNLLKIN